MKTVAIVQSNYIPWKGYFDLIAAVDEFIIYDDMQYTRRDWRNRNRIKTPQGLQWLTVPVKVKGRYLQKVRETRIDGSAWAAAHWQALWQNYRRARHFDEVAELLMPIYFEESFRHISVLNRRLIETINHYLGIRTIISDSWDYNLVEGKSERLAHLCEQAGAMRYVTGPAAKRYMEEAAFKKRGIEVIWFDYENYPDYPQLWGGFVHEVTILDLLFNCGRNAPNYMKQGRR